MFHKRYEIYAFVVMCFTSVGCYAGGSSVKSISQKGSGQAGTAAVKTVGSTCSSSDSNHICLAVKYVVYKDANDQATVDSDAAIENFKGINNVWSQCNIGFQIDQYEAVSPDTVGLNFSPANYSELPDIRTKFDDDSTLLIVTTGDWDRSGSLGNTGANAWTNLPGDSPYGVVLEQNVGTFSNIVAHEIGHYLNLLHVSDQSNLMNPIIYPDSDSLSSDQCELARSTALSSWQKMLR